MLFRKNIEPSCSYCKHSVKLNEETMACIKKGIVSPWEQCRRFSYDPLKRIPSAPVKLNISGIDDDTFRI